MKMIGNVSDWLSYAGGALIKVADSAGSTVEEELYYPCGESKGADQPLSYCEADLHLCFPVCKLLAQLFLMVKSTNLYCHKLS